MENSFVRYLNTLHNGTASNQNAIAEMQIGSEEFRQTRVKRPVTSELKARLEEGEAVVLTGHAGDGKTTILAQVLEEFDACPDRLEKADTVDCGKVRLHYVKDFSELTREEQKAELESCLRRQEEAALIIANTGPLLRAMGDLTGNPDMESCLLDAMDVADGKKLEVSLPDGFMRTVRILNIARLDNTDFIGPYLQNLTDQRWWKPCEGCPCREECPIRFNIRLIQERSERATQFIENCYIWLGEHNRRTTIRQITAHLAFSITGGLTCRRVQSKADPMSRYQYLFSNLFFGSLDRSDVKGADQIAGIALVKEAGFDRRPTVVDYTLFHGQAYGTYYTPLLGTYLQSLDEGRFLATLSAQRVLKRAYLLFGQNTAEVDEQQTRETFSRWFADYVRLWKKGGSLGSGMRNTICRAISILFVGEELKQEGSQPRIFLTLRRNNEQISNVQLVAGDLWGGDLRLKSEKASGLGGVNRYRLILNLQGKSLHFPISLPLLNYFDEIANGAIATDVDPMLSNGIDSLKAQLLSAVRHQETEDGEEDAGRREIRLIYMSGNHWEPCTLVVDGEHLWKE